MKRWKRELLILGAVGNATLWGIFVQAAIEGKIVADAGGWLFFVLVVVLAPFCMWAALVVAFSDMIKEDPLP